MRSLAVLAEVALDRLGDHVSLVFEEQRLRMAELQGRSERLAGGLAALGVAPGDRVVLQMSNRPEVPVVTLAAWRAAAVVTPVMPSLTPAELRHVVHDSGARVLVVSDDLRERAYDAVAGLDVTVVTSGDSDTGGSDIGTGNTGDTGSGGRTGRGTGSPGHSRTPVDLAALEQAEPLALRTPGDAAALLYTGGTTGRSKGVVLTHAGMEATTRARAQVVAAAEAPRLLVPLPLSHVFGLTNLVSRLHLAEPAPLVLQRRFHPLEWLRLVAEHGVQSSAVVPSMLQLLLREDLDAYDLSSLRYVTSGGAPLADAVRARFEERLPGCVVCDGYGCTEVTSTATMNPPLARRAGTVGRAIPGATVAVLDDAMRPLPAHEVGEVCVRSPGVMAGYWRDPEATAQAVVDGWLRTGDLGRLDDDGYLTIVDRKKDLVIRGGFNVYPRDVEDVLLAHPAVTAAAVVGRPDETYGEEVVAFVALRPGAVAGEQELLRHAAAGLAAHKRPRELYVVDVVPLTSVGKTDRKALRARVSGPA